MSIYIFWYAKYISYNYLFKLLITYFILSPIHKPSLTPLMPIRLLSLYSVEGVVETRGARRERMSKFID